MIIDIDHSLAMCVKVFDKKGNQLKYFQWVDTVQMIGEQIISWVPFAPSPDSTRIIKIYKIIGPGIYFERKPSGWVINTGRRK